MSALALLSRELDARLSLASIDHQRDVTLQVCRSAIFRSRLRQPLVESALRALESSESANESLLDELRLLTDQLDEKYAILREGDADYLVAFLQARAAAALLCAVSGEFGDAVYEAAFSFEGDDKSEFLSFVERALEN